MSTANRTYAGSTASSTYLFTNGYYFTVNEEVSVDTLAIFSPSGAAPPSGVTQTVWIANRSASTTILATTTFTNASPGTSDATNNMLYKSITPVPLPPGNYCIWESTRPANFQLHVYPGGGSAPVANTIGGAVTITGDYAHGSSTTLMPTAYGGIGVYYGGPTFFAASTTSPSEMIMTLDSTTPTNVTSSAWTQVAAAGKTVFVQAQKNAVYLRAKNTSPSETTGFILQPVDLANAQRDTGGTPAVIYTMNTGIQLYARAVDRDAIVCVMSD